LGLLGMRERLEMVSGKFNIASTPGKGTVVSVEIPVANGRPRAVAKNGTPQILL
jgi:signal transduction histidine kinase